MGFRVIHARLAHPGAQVVGHGDLGDTTERLPRGDVRADRAAWVDSATAAEVAGEVLVAVLGASGKLFVQATPSQDLGSWVAREVHEHPPPPA